MNFTEVFFIINTIHSSIYFVDKCKKRISTPNFELELELESLRNTVNTVKSVLEDAEAKQDGLSEEDEQCIEELKDGVYYANDVLDEFVTLAKQTNLTEEVELSSKVKEFFSTQNDLSAFGLSNKVEDVKKMLDVIVSDTSNKCLLKIDNSLVKFTNPGTYFELRDDKMIGRDEDVEKIVSMLLDSDNNVDQPNVSFLGIVGTGGLGKTALAKLVYNDPRIVSAFQLRSWTSISDQDPDLWYLSDVLYRVLRDLTVEKRNVLTDLDEIHLEIRKLLEGKKYLLVLDDLWTESSYIWELFLENLIVEETGSWILVTTRSENTAQFVGGETHELEGLSMEDSWCLFERMAFLPEQRETPDDELVEIGKDIVRKCFNVPLAIRVVGSLLCGQLKDEWLVLRDEGLASISENNIVNHVLRLSYHQLSSSLKSCFAYCAVFPKDSVIDKRKLISLWMAQGYISVDYEGEEYFHLLVQRCFFEDVSLDQHGEIQRFKINDVVHEFVVQVAGKDVFRLDTDTLFFVDERIRHLSITSDEYTSAVYHQTHFLTCLHVEQPRIMVEIDQSMVDLLIANWRCLRTLDFSMSDAESFPESIGELLHLRYLDLSSTKIKKLPKSITKLINLQTLDLSNCTNLQELPDDVSKLHDLSTLNVDNCSELSHMPSGMGMLTQLHTLGLFVLGRTSSDGMRCLDGLEDLLLLDNLKGSLKIEIGLLRDAKYVKEDCGGGAYLMKKQHLKSVTIEFKEGEEYGSMESEQLLLEDMKPHPDLRELMLIGYHGAIMPRWPRKEDSSTLFHLPNLVTLVISQCWELQSLPSHVGELPRLKSLRLATLPKMEYLVNFNPDADESLFFPCLEHLDITDLPKAEGWWLRSGSRVENEHLIPQTSPCFPQLKFLDIVCCPMLTSIPTCPSLKSLRVDDSNIKL